MNREYVCPCLCVCGYTYIVKGDVDFPAHGVTHQKFFGKVASRKVLSLIILRRVAEKDGGAEELRVESNYTFKTFFLPFASPLHPLLVAQVLTQFLLRCKFCLFLLSIRLILCDE